MKINKADKTEVSNSKLKEKVKDKQLQHVIVILIEMIRNNVKLVALLNNDNSQNIIKQSKYLLSQALTVFYWINGK